MTEAPHTTRLANRMPLQFASSKSTAFCQAGGDALRLNQRSWVGKHGLNPNPWSIIGQARKVSLPLWLQFRNLSLARSSVGHLYEMQAAQQVRARQGREVGSRRERVQTPGVAPRAAAGAGPSPPWPKVSFSST